MSIIEEIRADVNARWGRNEISDESHRRKIAWLERLEEPTRKMQYAAFDAGGSPDFRAAYKAALKAAEEDLP